MPAHGPFHLNEFGYFWAHCGYQDCGTAYWIGGHTLPGHRRALDRGLGADPFLLLEPCGHGSLVPLGLPRPETELGDDPLPLGLRLLAAVAELGGADLGRRHALGDGPQLALKLSLGA